MKTSRRTRQVPISDPKNALAQALRRGKQELLKKHAKGLATTILRQWAGAEWNGSLWITNSKLSFDIMPGYSTRDLMAQLVADGWGTRASNEGADSQRLVPSTDLVKYLEAIRSKHQTQLENYRNGLKAETKERSKLEIGLVTLESQTKDSVAALQEQIDQMKADQQAMWEAIRYIQANDAPVTAEKIERRLMIVAS